MLLGDGSGNFSAPHNFAAGDSPTGVVAADFNGDTLLDLAVSNRAANTVSVLLNSPPAPPVAVDDVYPGATEDQQFVVSAENGVLANDTDANGDPLTAKLATDVSNGTLTLNADGSFTYKPTADFSGSDSFTYNANDGAADSNVATVNITVEAAPPPPPDPDPKPDPTPQPDPKPTCNDGRDNDGDGKVDLRDPGCSSKSDNSEFNPEPKPDPNACTIKGNDKSNILRGTPGRDVICSFGGNDIIRGLGGNDLIKGGKGNDILHGGRGNDRLLGQGGNDVLYGGSGRDVLVGGPGKNVLNGGAGKDVEKGGVSQQKMEKKARQLTEQLLKQILPIR